MNGAIVSVEERCPDCGCKPDDDTVHRDGCARVDTCGQFGPPWLAAPWHPETGPGQRPDDITTAQWLRDSTWQRELHTHRREVHGLGGGSERVS